MKCRLIRKQRGVDVSPVFYKLLEFLDLVAEFLSRRKAFCRLHKERCNLVTAQQACDTTLQSMEHTGLHYSYTHTHTHTRTNTQSISQYLIFISVLLMFLFP